MHIENYDYLGQELDISSYFNTIGNSYFTVENLVDFDESTLTACVRFTRKERKGRLSFSMYTCPFEDSQSWEFPPAYTDSPTYKVQFSFTAANIVRMSTSFHYESHDKDDSLMLDSVAGYTDVTVQRTQDVIMLKTSAITVEIATKLFAVTVKDNSGKVLTKTVSADDSYCLQNYNPLPLSYVRSSADLKKHSAFSMLISPDEHFYGCGESFTRLDKLGQKVHLFTIDAQGVQTNGMYKPVPFYMSSRGYGVFTHTSAPVTLDFGNSYNEAQTIFIGDDNVDVFIIAGTPKEILEGYTDLTGKSPTPALWSFGLWMARITYKEETEVREVAAKMREHKIPCDVIHLDTGWFEEDWCCDYEFSKERFDSPQNMIKDVKDDGYHISLWQLPYFGPKNPRFNEIMSKGLHVKDADGRSPTDELILDFSNPDTVKWYSETLGKLFEMGVSVIKADFGEAAPLKGVYHSKKSGNIEHNLYPLRYNKAVHEATSKYVDNAVIWGRSAWAGSQRYPLHWGGDSENTNMGMLSSVRGGLSFGMSGFTYWSHDVGGFVKVTPKDLYARWMFFGIFSSHIRCHGQAPKEPWEFGDEFLALYRKQVNLRYMMMPYIYAHSVYSSQKGYPLLRSMFFEFPQDANCLNLEDQYMFGGDILVAPLFEEAATHRDVYLPKGNWIDLLHPNDIYEGEKWHSIAANELCGVALVRAGAVIPMVDVAQCTRDIDWNSMKYHHYTTGKEAICGIALNPSDMTIFDATEKSLDTVRVIKPDVTLG